MKWQDIETAPKDGIRILLHEQDGSMGVFFHKRNFAQATQWWESDAGDCAIRPTHWMPLPPPPDTFVADHAEDPRFAALEAGRP